MSIEPNPRESKRINELMNEYQGRGYKVIIPTKKEDVPVFLRKAKYLPDLIATKKSEGLIVEVKSNPTRHSFDQLSKVSGIVNGQKGWKFVLVLTNPKDSATAKSNTSITKVNELLAKSVAIGGNDKTHREAAFLFAWVALEAALRLLLKENAAKSPWSLVRDAAIAGYVDRKDAQLLERLVHVRNSILHAGDVAAPELDDVEFLRKVVREVVVSSMMSVG